MSHTVLNNHLLNRVKRLILNLSTNTSKFYIAFSGGMDSHILLHVIHHLFSHLPLQALHVNHGLHPEATKWAIHCQTICDALNIPLHIEDIASQLHSKVYQEKSKGPEEAARNARYAILKAKLKANDCLLTGHHIDDQAETLLLQLSRGSGVQGLASMPFVTKHQAGYYHLRPLLDWTYEERITYAKQHQLTWIEDSSNLDQHFTRNFIRHSILPGFKKRWPRIAKIFSRTADHCAEASNLCAEVAQQDLSNISQNEQNRLSIEGLMQLSSARSRNALRYWLKQQLDYFPASAQLHQIEQLLYSKKSYLELFFKNRIFKRYRSHLYSLPQKTDDRIPISPIPWDIREPLKLNSGYTLIAKSTQGIGIRRALLSKHPILEVCFRKGGECFRPSGRNGSHSLKKLYQEWNILPWQRSEVPLLYFQDKLIAVAGYAIAEDNKAHAKEPGISIVLTKNS